MFRILFNITPTVIIFFVVMFSLGINSVATCASSERSSKESLCWIYLDAFEGLSNLTVGSDNIITQVMKKESSRFNDWPKVLSGKGVPSSEQKIALSKKLLKIGVDINAKDSKGSTALSYALKTRDKELITFFAGENIKPLGKGD